MSYGTAERAAIDIDEFERRLRGPAPRPTGDPLAELARLVTPADAKPEALDALFARPQPLSEASHAPQHDEQNFRFDDLRGPVVDDHSFAPDAFDHVFDRAPESSDRYAGAAEPNDEWQPHVDERLVSEVAQPRSKRPLYATAAVIAVGLLGIGGTFAFKGHRNGSGDLIEVKAAPGPTKVQAQAAATDSNSTSANSTVLDRGVTPQPVTRVVTRQEQPVDLKEAARTPRVVSIAPTGSAQMASLAAAASGDNGSVFAEPRKVKTVSVRPDGTIMGSSTVDSPAAGAASQTPATQTPQPPARSAATPKTVARVATTPKPPVEKPEAAAKPVAAKPVATKPAPAKVARAADPDDDTAADATPAPASPRASAGGGGFSVQLAAPGSETEARSVASRLGQKFSGQLGGARVTVQKASDKEVYRVRTASMSRADAVSACEKIKSAGGTCFVAKN